MPGLTCSQFEPKELVLNYSACYILLLPLTRGQAHARMCAHTHTHASMHASARAHAHTHTHTHTHLKMNVFLNLFIFTATYTKKKVLIFRVLTICNHPNIVPTSCYQFQYTCVRPHDLQVSCPNSPAIVQITLSSVKLCLSLSDIDCFHALYKDTPLQSF